jgi:hypothetical protein
LYILNGVIVEFYTNGSCSLPVTLGNKLAAKIIH